MNKCFYCPSFALSSLVIIGFFIFPGDAAAQRLSERLQKNQSDTLARRPNDQVEGTIWEYKSTEYKSTLKKGEPEPQLSGKIRIEGTAVFDANHKIKIEGRDDRLKKIKGLVQGKETELELPGATNEKRIGEYKKISNGKIRFDFNDTDGLHGTMIAWPKPDSNGVWLANYSQKDGTKTTGKWLMELRPIKD